LAIDIIMPKWGMAMKEGKVTRWLKTEGETIAKGEPLFEVETEKITNQVESTAGGVLFQIVIQEGTVAPVGAVVAVVAEPGEQPERNEGTHTGDAVEAKTAAPAASAKEIPGEKEKKKFVVASPAARRMAKELGLELSAVPGSGPDGRVTESDVKKYHEQGPARPSVTPLAAEMAGQAGIDISAIDGTGDGKKITADDVERVLARQAKPEPVRTIPFSGMRKAIADNMHGSLMGTAQLTAFTEVDVTELVRFRDMVRDEYKNDESVRISFNDIFILVTAKTLKRFPIMNSTLVENEIILHDTVNMGMAVALEEGLIVPVLKDADKKGLVQIAREARELIRSARAGAISVDDVTGGTFTVTNLSMFGIDGVTPILRPPETGILGLCRIKQKPSVYRGNIAIRSMMTVCLTFDHRVVDGAPASEFLQTLARNLEEPALLLT